ncbi:MAG: hypothetical protein GAK29_04108 [Acinetobacter bereziniae]|uniref:Uncharacterized protein n=1 Tax=Acinetobacter bereziniae TaxID=106648 RepID=A0A833PAM7_ACIBZ|nr:MAG: hypothetical protein GAK29_04108 [Acinetobacter bereziniae]
MKIDLNNWNIIKDVFIKAQKAKYEPYRVFGEIFI